MGLTYAMPTVDQENEIAYAQQLSRARQLAAAFRDVFGLPGHRTPLGEIILSELERFCSWNSLISERDQNGRIDDLAHHQKYGRYQVIKAIHNLIEWKESEHVHPRPGST